MDWQRILEVALGTAAWIVALFVLACELYFLVVQDWRWLA